MKRKDKMKPVNLKLLLEELECRYLLKAYKSSKGNNTEAAKSLMMNRTTYLAKMKRFFDAVTLQ